MAECEENVDGVNLKRQRDVYERAAHAELRNDGGSERSEGTLTALRPVKKIKRRKRQAKHAHAHVRLITDRLDLHSAYRHAGPAPGVRACGVGCGVRVHIQT